MTKTIPGREELPFRVHSRMDSETLRRAVQADFDSLSGQVEALAGALAGLDEEGEEPKPEPAQASIISVKCFVRKRKRRLHYGARVKFNQVTDNVDAGLADISYYVVQGLACNSGGTPLDLDDDSKPLFFKQHVPVPDDGDTDDLLKAVFRNLPRPKTWYFKFRVAAVDENGRRGAWSGWSTPVNPYTDAPTSPPAVTGLAVEHPTDRRWVWTWDDPGEDSGIDRYKVQVYRKDGPSTFTLVETGYTRNERYAYNAPAADIDKKHKAKVTPLDENGVEASSPQEDTESSNTEDAAVRVYGATEDDAVAEIVPGSVGFDHVSVGSIEGPILGIGDETLVMHVDPVYGDPDNDGKAPHLLSDTFTRTTGSGWGTADSSHVWTVLEGLASRWWCSGTLGLHQNVASTGEINHQHIAGYSLMDDLLFSWKYNTNPTGTSHPFGPSFRVQDANNHFYFRLVISTAGALSSGVRKIVGGTPTTLVTDTSWGSLSTDTWYKTRAQCYYDPQQGGVVLRMRTWLAAGSEPTTWDIEYLEQTDFLTSPGAVGMRTNPSAAQTNAVTLYFDDAVHSAVSTAGDVLSGAGPLNSVNTVSSRTPNYLNSDLFILVGENGTQYAEDIFIGGYLGSGRLYLLAAPGLVLDGSMQFHGCNMFIRVTGDWEIQDTGGGSSVATVFVNVSRHVELDALIIQSNSKKNDSVRFTQGSEGAVTNSQLNGSTSDALSAYEGSVLRATNNKGSGGYKTSASLLFITGTTAGTNITTALQGQYFGSMSTDAGTTPGTSTKVTKTWLASKTGSWRTTTAWRTDNDYVYQGEWSYGNHKGCWFYPSAMFSTLSGKTIDAAYITVRRRSEGGMAGAQTLYVFSTSQSGPSGGEPNIVSGPTKLGSLAWGETKTFKLPSGIASDLANGKNLGIYQSSGNPYLICQGVKEYEKSGRLEVTYH